MCRDPHASVNVRMLLVGDRAGCHVLEAPSFELTQWGRCCRGDDDATTRKIDDGARRAVADPRVFLGAAAQRM